MTAAVLELTSTRPETLMASEQSVILLLIKDRLRKAAYLFLIRGKQTGCQVRFL